MRLAHNFRRILIKLSLWPFNLQKSEAHETPRPPTFPICTCASALKRGPSALCTRGGLHPYPAKINSILPSGMVSSWYLHRLFKLQIFVRIIRHFTLFRPLTSGMRGGVERESNHTQDSEGQYLAQWHGTCLWTPNPRGRGGHHLPTTQARLLATSRLSRRADSLSRHYPHLN